MIASVLSPQSHRNYLHRESWHFTSPPHLEGNTAHVKLSHTHTPVLDASDVCGVVDPLESPAPRVNMYHAYAWTPRARPFSIPTPGAGTQQCVLWIPACLACHPRSDVTCVSHLRTKDAELLCERSGAEPRNLDLCLQTKSLVPLIYQIWFPWMPPLLVLYSTSVNWPITQCLRGTRRPSVRLDNCCCL